MSETKRPGRPPIRVMPPRIPDTTGECRPCADVEGPAPPGRPPFNALRIREGAAMTLRFIVACILREPIELADRDGVAVGRDQVPVGEEAPA